MTATITAAREQERRWQQIGPKRYDYPGVAVSIEYAPGQRDLALAALDAFVEQIRADVEALP